tara:strand:+ start:293 stop:775 length:483 start_codon:yes stop_codon:yes gene_type:complete
MNKSRWLTVALLVSIAVNLLLVGIFFGRVILGGPGPERMPSQLGWMIRHLDEPTRESLRSEMVEHIKRAGPLRKQMRSVQQTFNRQLLESTIDTEAMSQSLAELRHASDEYQTEMHEMMLLILPELDEQQRRQVLSTIRRGPDQPRGPDRPARRNGDRKQ